MSRSNKVTGTKTGAGAKAGAEAGAETTASTTESEGKKKKDRIDFPIKDAQYRNNEGQVVSAVNSEGLLLAVPVTIADDSGKILYKGFDVRKHKPLKKTSFAEMTTFLYYQAFIARLHAAKYVKIAEAKEANAKNLGQFANEQTRKKAQKVQKMKEQLAILEKQLSEEGVDVKTL